MWRASDFAGRGGGRSGQERLVASCLSSVVLPDASLGAAVDADVWGVRDGRLAILGVTAVGAGRPRRVIGSAGRGGGVPGRARASRESTLAPQKSENAGVSVYSCTVWLFALN